MDKIETTVCIQKKIKRKRVRIGNKITKNDCQNAKKHEFRKNRNTLILINIKLKAKKLNFYQNCFKI